MDSRTSDLDGNHGVQGTNGSFEWCEVVVFVWEDTKHAWFDSEAYTARHVLFGWFEPCVALCLFEDVV